MTSWTCCGEFMYMARSERDDEGTPVHTRRCHTCGATVETEERLLRRGSFHLRAESARARNRRYASFDPRLCRVCQNQYYRRGYGRHIKEQRHQRALAIRRRANHWKQVEAQARYRGRLRIERVA